MKKKALLKFDLQAKNTARPARTSIIIVFDTDSGPGLITQSQL